MECNTHKELTAKQEAFCRAYMETMNATEAYRRAYASEKMTDRTICRRAGELMMHPAVSARIRYLKDNAAEASGITVQRIIREHARIAFSDATRVRSGWYTLKEFESLTEDERACIKSVETKQRKMLVGDGDIVMEEWVKVQAYDKQKALDSLSRILGYDAPQKVEGTLSLRGLTVQVMDEDTAARLKELTGQ